MAKRTRKSKRSAGSSADAPSLGFKEPTERERMEMRADSMAHDMAVMHPTFKKLKDGMKRQVMGMMQGISKGSRSLGRAGKVRQVRSA